MVLTWKVSLIGNSICYATANSIAFTFVRITTFSKGQYAVWVKYVTDEKWLKREIVTLVDQSVDKIWIFWP